MITFKLDEVKEVPELGHVVVIHTISLRPEDVRGWNKQEITYQKETEVLNEDGTKERETIIEELLSITMKDTFKTYEMVDVPKMIKGEIVYKKEVKEVEKNVTYNVGGSQLAIVLEQLQAQI